MTPQRQAFFKSRVASFGDICIRYDIEQAKSEIKKHKAFLNENKKQRLSGNFDVQFSLRYINKLTAKIKKLRCRLRYLP